MMNNKGFKRFWALLLALLLLPSAGVPALAADGDNYAEGYLDTYKSAEAIDADQGIYEISLRLQGEPTYTTETLQNGADVVMVMDLSDSMSTSRWRTATAAASSLVDLLLVESDADVRVGVVGFAGATSSVAAHAPLTPDGFTYDPDVATANFLSTVQLTRSAVGIASAGTNSHAGLIGAQEMVDEDRAAEPDNAERDLFVIFIADGGASQYYSTYVDRNNFTRGSGSSASREAAVKQATVLKEDYDATIYSVYCSNSSPSSSVLQFMVDIASDESKYALGTEANVENVFLEIGRSLLEEVDVTLEHQEVLVVDRMSDYVDYLDDGSLKLQRRPAASTSDGDWVTCTAGEAGTASYADGVLTWTMDEMDCDYAYRMVYTVQVKHAYAGQTPHRDQSSGRDTAQVADGVGVLANGYTYVASSLVDEQEILVPSIYREGEVTVTFYLNDGTAGVHDQQTLIRGYTADDPGAPTRPGYTFGGWYLDADCRDAFSLDTPVTEDLDLYAKWTPQYYTVIYNANNGSGQTHKVDTEIVGQAHQILGNDVTGFVNSGYAFIGWSKDAPSDVQFTDSTVTGTAEGEVIEFYAIWSAEYYSVVYHAQNGTGDTETRNQLVDSPHAVLGNDAVGFTYTGHRFVGWSRTEGSDVLYTGNTVISSVKDDEIHLYAVWEPVYYTITYHAQNSAGDTYSATELVDYPHTVLGNDVVGFTNTGYAFAGWSLAPNSDDIYTGDDVIGQEEGDVIHLYAVWSAQHYQVVYHAQNSADDTYLATELVDHPHTVLGNDAVGFTNTGYAFAGWSLAPDSGDIYTGDTVTGEVAGEVIDLYAVWSPVYYTVIYHAQNGTNATTERQELVGHPHTVLDSLFSYTGYAFMGWSLTENSDTLYTGGTVTGEKEGEVIDLYAVWSAQHYQVVYHAQNGADDTYSVTELVDHPHTVLGNATVGFTNTGYAFAGWSLTPDSGDIYTGDTVTGEVAGEVIDLYAVWSPVYYTVIYHAQNGTNATTERQELVGHPHTVLGSLFTYTGYAFAGWSRTANSDTLYTGGTVTGQEEGEEIHLYAVWSPQYYQVAYHAGEGTGDTVERQELVGHAHTVLGNGTTGFSRNGYAFVGWSYSAGAGSADVSPGGTVTGTRQGQVIDLYAVWSPLHYNVVYHANNGTSATYEAAELIGSPHSLLSSEAAGFTYADNSFLGWSYDAYALTPDFYPGGTVTGEEEGQVIDLYAVWEEIIYPAAADYTVIYDPNGGYGTRYTTTEAAGDRHTVLNNLLEELSFYNINHVFVAWSTDPDATVDDQCIEPGTWISGEEGETIVLYAVWNPLPFRITPHYSYLQGFEDGEIKPMENLTRAQAATILFRLLDDDIREEYYTADNTFPDVGKEDWFNKAVSTIVNMGAIEGYDDGTFRPNDNITRAELATIIAKLSGVEYTGTGHYFSDIAGWYQDYINLAASLGWVSGYEDGTFKPQNYITRAETVTMINNVLDRNPQSEEDMLPGMKTWPDNADPTQWYYLGIQEATNSHTFERDEYGVERWLELVENPDWDALEKP